MPQVRIRQGYVRNEPHPLNQFPFEVIEGIAKRIVHLRSIGHTDVSGDEFQRIFSEAIDGISYASPLGVADVTWNGCAWSVKTVKNNHPHRFQVRRGRSLHPRTLRLISGRNSPGFSAGIANPLADVQQTGNAVIEVFNQRLAEARKKHDDVRMVVLVRNMDTQEFTLFERSMAPWPVNDFIWTRNSSDNLEAHVDGRHVFTWQPHGSQFTMKEPIPQSATRFRITGEPAKLPMQQVLELSGYSAEWVEVLKPGDSLHLNRLPNQ